MAEDPVLDGTYEPAPPPLLADPLSGLVTGANLPAQRREEIPRVAAPAMPDAAEIREAVDAALEEEEARPVRRPAPVPEPPGSREAPGLMRQWPAVVVRRLRATKDQVPELVRKPASVQTGITVVIVIVLVTAVLLYYVITSLADTFGKLF